MKNLNPSDIYETEVNLERDLNECEWIKKKIAISDAYAQNLYAALCNTIWSKNSFIPTLTGENEWSCSWRYAGGIIAELKGYGDYMDWYCSGMGSLATYDIEAGERYMEEMKYVPESIITMEIAEDLAALGWKGRLYDE